MHLELPPSRFVCWAWVEVTMTHKQEAEKLWEAVRSWEALRSSEKLWEAEKLRSCSEKHACEAKSSAAREQPQSQVTHKQEATKNLGTNMHVKQIMASGPSSPLVITFGAAVVWLRWVIRRQQTRKQRYSDSWLENRVLHGIWPLAVARKDCRRHCNLPLTGGYWTTRYRVMNHTITTFVNYWIKQHEYLSEAVNGRRLLWVSQVAISFQAQLEMLIWFGSDSMLVIMSEVPVSLWWYGLGVKQLLLWG